MLTCAILICFPRTFERKTEGQTHTVQGLGLHRKERRSTIEIPNKTSKARVGVAETRRPFRSSIPLPYLDYCCSVVQCNFAFLMLCEVCRGRGMAFVLSQTCMLILVQIVKVLSASSVLALRQTTRLRLCYEYLPELPLCYSIQVRDSVLCRILVYETLYLTLQST